MADLPSFVPQWKRQPAKQQGEPQGSRGSAASELGPWSSRRAGGSPEDRTQPEPGGRPGWRGSSLHSNGSVTPPRSSGRPGEELGPGRPRQYSGPSAGYATSREPPVGLGGPRHGGPLDREPLRRRSPSPPGGFGRGGPDGGLRSAASDRPAASSSTASSASTYQKVAFEKDFPSLKGPPPGYAPREAPYKQTFLSARVGSGWTSKLADAPPPATATDDQGPSSGGAARSLSSGGGLGTAAAAGAGRSPPTSGATAAASTPAPSGWSSIAQAQASKPSDAAAGLGGLAGVPSTEKLREALAVKQSKQLIPVMAKKPDDSSKGKTGQPTLLGKLPRQPGPVADSKLLARAGSAAPTGGMASLGSIGGTVTLTKKASAPLDKPLVVPKVASSAAASLGFGESLQPTPGPAASDSQDAGSGAAGAAGSGSAAAQPTRTGVEAGNTAQGSSNSPPAVPTPELAAQGRVAGEPSPPLPPRSGPATTPAAPAHAAGAFVSPSPSPAPQLAAVPVPPTPAAAMPLIAPLAASAGHLSGHLGAAHMADAVGEPLGLGGDDADALMLLPEDLLGDDEGGSTAVPSTAQQQTQQPQQPVTSALQQAPLPQGGWGGVGAAQAPGLGSHLGAHAGLLLQQTALLQQSLPFTNGFVQQAFGAPAGHPFGAAAAATAQAPAGFGSLSWLQAQAALPGYAQAPLLGVQAPQPVSPFGGQQPGAGSPFHPGVHLHAGLGLGGALGQGLGQQALGQQAQPPLHQSASASKFQVSAEEEAFLRSLGWNDAEDSTDDVLTEDEIAAFKASAQARGAGSASTGQLGSAQGRPAAGAPPPGFGGSRGGGGKGMWQHSAHTVPASSQFMG